MLVDAALEVAENKIAALVVVTEVTESLHNLAPGLGLSVSSAAAVELFIVVDKRLAEYLLFSPRTVPGLP